VSAHFILLANPLFYRKASFVIASELARGSCSQASCHCEANLPTFLVIANPKWGDAICLQATLVFRLLRNARKDKNQDGRAAQVPFTLTTLH
jgi:predicted CxxxxCH...CXXCH cytochrome family protein